MPTILSGGLRAPPRRYDWQPGRHSATGHRCRMSLLLPNTTLVASAGGVHVEDDLAQAVPRRDVVVRLADPVEGVCRPDGHLQVAARDHPGELDHRRPRVDGRHPGDGDAE